MSIKKFKAHDPKYSYLGHFRDPEILECGHNVSGYDENVPRAPKKEMQGPDISQETLKGFSDAYKDATNMKKEVTERPKMPKSPRSNY